MLIEFKDIRKGDHITVTRAYGDFTQTSDGVAAELTVHGEWVTSRGYSLVDSDSKPESIVLVDRPTPELPTEPGSVIVDVVTHTGVDYGTMFLDSQGDWEAVILPNKGTFRWLLPSEIKSFRLAKVVPADD